MNYIQTNIRKSAIYILTVIFSIFNIDSTAQCGFQGTCSNTNYLNFGMGSNNDAATIEYDNFVSMFHSTVVRTAYGTYKVWGQKMANDGVNHHLSPVEITQANYPALTGEILKAHLGSDFVTIGQGIVLTTTGLFAWSDEGAVLHPDITTGTVFQKLTINGQTDGLPAGIDPLDVKMLFSTHGNLALVTCSGDVYIITQFFNNTGNGHTAVLSVADQTRWHQVRQATSGNPFLTNVVAVRGNRNTLFALKSDGTLWTWGEETYLGNNTVHQARNYATQMTLPSANPIKMIGVTRDNSSSRPSYYVLNTNGNLYSLGHNAFRQLGDWTTTERLQWIQPRYTSSGGPVMNNIHWLTPNEHDSRYAAVNVLTIDSTNYNWGEANFQMLGRGSTGAFNPGIPNGISASDKILAVETGGHTSMLIKKCEDFFGYVGHRINGSMGNGSAANATEASYTFATAVVYICGATTAEISLTGTPSEGPNGRYCNLSTAELSVSPPGGTLSVLSGPGSLNGNQLTFTGNGNTTVTVRYIVTVPGCPIPDTAEIELLTEDCYFPSWTLTKTASPTTYSSAGDVISYNITVVNTGNVGIGSVSVTDVLATTGPTYQSGDINNNSILDTLETWNYNATRSIIQDDMDAGSFTNTASASGVPVFGTVNNVSDMATVIAQQNPAIQIQKSANPAIYSIVGENIAYSFLVTNTGNVTLSNVTVSDPLFGLTYGPVTLAPGANQTFTHNYAITQADIDQGSIYNLATVNGQDPNGDPVSAQDDETINAVQTPSINLTKTADPATYTNPGQIIEYTFSVNNTGNVTLSDVIVTDPLFGLTLGPVNLAPGANQTFTYNYTVTQADLDQGSVYNLATANGQDPNGNPVTDADDETITAVQLPAIQLVKTATPAMYSVVGQNIDYSFVVTNTGNVTLTDVTVEDPLFGLMFGPINLSPGSSQTYTYTYAVQQIDLDLGSIFNEATATGTFDGTDYTAMDDVTVEAIRNPDLVLTKSADPVTYSVAGQLVEYTFILTNTGNVTLDNITTTDPLFGLNFYTALLAPGAMDTFTYMYTVTQTALDTGSVFNVATSTYNYDAKDYSASDNELITANQNPDVSIVKSASPSIYSSPGENIVYTFTAENTGNVTLTNVIVSDPLFGLTFGPVTLAPGASQNFTFNYTVTQTALDTGSVYNVALVTAEDPDGNPVNDTDDETITAVQSPAVELQKSAVPLTYSTLGETVEYTFTATNTGNVTLSNVVVQDPLFGTTFGPVTLAPGASQSFTHNYTVTQSALDTGIVYNVATVTADDTNGNPVSDTDDETITAVQLPDIQITKTADPVTYSVEGEVVQYTFTVTNTGNVTLSDILVDDPLFGLTFGPVTLAPGDVQLFTFDYYVTQPAVDTGSVYNVATVTADDTNGNQLSDTDDETITAIQNPSVELIKSATPAVYDAAGDMIQYTFVVTNTGNVTLSDVMVQDPLFGISFGPVTLAPGQNEQFMYEYSITQQDVDAGSVYNIAEVTANDPNGNPVSNTDEETVLAIQNSGINLVKSALTSVYFSAGDLVEYTFTATNTGNVTLSNVFITDPLFGLSFGPFTLAPGAVETFNHTYTVTQAALDTGYVYNQAMVEAEDPNGGIVNDTDDETITANQIPNIELVKSASASVYGSAGDLVEYTFTTTNTGNVTLTNVIITDPLFGLSFGPVILGPGTSESFTYMYTVTQPAVDTGYVYNIASVEGTDTNGNSVTDVDDETINAIQIPAIDLVKSANPVNYTTAGQLIDYTFIATNNGNVTLTNVVITDPLFGLSFGPVTLAPGTSETFTYSYSVTQAALDTGYVYNQAMVQAEDPNGFVLNDTDDETITAVQIPVVQLDKSASPLTFNIHEQEITYTFVATNIGNVTLTNVVVSDPLFGINLGPVTLSPGSSETFTYIYMTTQNDLDNGGIYNVATVSGEDTNGNTVIDSDDETVTAIQFSGIELDKTASPIIYSNPGDIIQYTFVVTNTGNVTLTNVMVEDPLFGAVFGPVTIIPWHTATFTYNYPVTQVDIDGGSIYNLASTSGQDPNGNILTDTDDETVMAIQNPQLDLVKTANPVTYTTPGENVEYTFVVTNTGNVTLTNVMVSDPLFGISFGPVTLSPNGSDIFTHQHIISQPEIDNGSIYNIATATGDDPNNNAVSATDDETINAVQTPSITLYKSALPVTYDNAGDIITFTFEVVNTGNVTLDNVTISDPLFGLNYGPVTLSPNASQMYTYNYAITQADMDNGSIYNLATATGEDPNGDPVSDDDDETIDAIQNPSINLIKQANPMTYDSPGDLIQYTFIVSNNGNVTLNNVVVQDPLFSLNFGPVTLLPGGNQVYSFTYTTTQQNVNAGSILNIANATGYDPQNNPVFDSDQVTVLAIQTPSINIQKDGVFNDINGDGFAQPGETMTFTFDVTNSGNVTLYNVVINDPAIGVSNLPLTPSTLAPGQSGFTSVNYPVTAEDITNGGKYNVATAIGTTLTNIFVSDASDDPTPLDPTDENYNSNCPNCTYVDLNRPSSVSDLVWHDLNGNGLQDIGEPGIPNVYVHLYRQDGLYIGSRLTNASGLYNFEFVIPGSYQLRFDIPSGFTPTFKDQGNDNLDSDINATGSTDVFIVGSEEIKNNMDAGMYRCVPIGELVWYDSNKNDVADDVENGINGLVVRLWRNQSGTWTMWGETTTGHKPGTPSDDGYWRFCAPPGQYYVQVVMPPLGLVRARPNVGNNPFTNSDLTNANGILTTNAFNVISGGQKLDIGGGFYPMATAGNLVWIDDNINGIQDAFEPPVEGVEVSARDVQTGQVVKSSVTDHNGQYELDYLEQRDIYLQFTLPQEYNGYQPTLPRIGTDDADSDVDGSFGSMTTRAFAMLSGISNENIDMGIVQGALPVTWGRVFALKVSEGHLVRWSTFREINAGHFIVERKRTNEDLFTPVSGMIPSAGNVNEEQWYEFTDTDVRQAGRYVYRIRQVDRDGTFLYSQEVSLMVDENLQVDVYPNPTAMDATVEIRLEADAEISVMLFGSEGKYIKTIKEKVLFEKGKVSIPIQMNDLAQGVYTVVIQIGGTRLEKRLVKVVR